MAILSFTGATIWAGLSDLSNDTNDIVLNTMAAPLDTTNFASAGWSSFQSGLRSAKLDVKGFTQIGTPDAPDDFFFGNIGVGGLPVTISPLGATVGNVCYLGTFLEPLYKTGAKVGALLTFDTPAVLDAPLVRGQVASVVAKTTTGTTAGINLGAPTSTQRVYCNLHVLTVSGTGSPTLTAVLQGDTGSGFPAPVTVATSSAITAASSQQIKGAVGVTTSTWYRLSLTISGTSPSFLLYAAIGVG